MNFDLAPGLTVRNPWIRLTVGKQRFQRFTDFGISCTPLVCDFSSCDGAIALRIAMKRQTDSQPSDHLRPF